MSEQEMKQRIDELEDEVAMFKAYWQQACLFMDDDLVNKIRVAVNQAALTP